MPCQLLFSIEIESICKKTEQLIQLSLDLSGVEYPESQTKNGRKHVADAYLRV